MCPPTRLQDSPQLLRSPSKRTRLSVASAPNARTPGPPTPPPSQPLLQNSQRRVEGELRRVGPAVGQQQGARLGPVARRQQLGGASLHVPATLPLVGQQVGDEGGVQGRRDAAD